MLAKLAVLFLVGMVVMALVLARPKKRGGGKRVDGKARGKGKLRAAAKCPDCGAWIVEGARCPCRRDGGA